MWRYGYPYFYPYPTPWPIVPTHDPTTMAMKRHDRREPVFESSQSDWIEAYHQMMKYRDE